MIPEPHVHSQTRIPSPPDDNPARPGTNGPAMTRHHSTLLSQGKTP
ncbi:hypothetical protein [Gluconobacter wancherniae]|nr:hypothetical protein [Gluconobacter wancherniae]